MPDIHDSTAYVVGEEKNYKQEQVIIVIKISSRLKKWMTSWINSQTLSNIHRLEQFTNIILHRLDHGHKTILKNMQG